MPKIMVTGALGQIGTELTRALRERFGQENVLSTSRRSPKPDVPESDGPFEQIDVTDESAIDDAVARHQIDTALLLWFN